ncbi:unnamed protein product [Allacma fusca]|uniref:F-box domain-containing protein n=1 Tax=Allacma fusca TaxID=39272 RepID=A0A8J2KE69_9HEXA|nr:unnamed protein product [Allacma fusca]
MDPNENFKVSPTGSQNFQPLEKKSKKETEESESTLEESDQMGSFNTTVIAGTVFDNIVILKEIFGYLSPTDLKTCCDVNETWRSVADPTFFVYRIVWSSLTNVKVKTTRGCVDPQIQLRTSSIAAETEYLQSLRRAVYIDLEVNFNCYFSSDEVNECRAFITRFGAMVYLLTYVRNPSSARSYFLCGFDENERTTDVVSCHDFPNTEELRLFGMSTELFICPDDYFRLYLPLPSVQKFCFRRCRGTKYEHLTAAKLLELLPNVKEIYGAPVTMVKGFRNMEKLNLLRSVGFYKHNPRMSEVEGMKSLVKAEMKFQFLIVGKLLRGCPDLIFIERNRQSFEALLELGKHTLEHLVIRALKPEALVNFPNEMPAVKHITLWGRRTKGYLYFRDEEDVIKRFPNLNTVSFHNFKGRTFESLWVSGGMFKSSEARQRIKYLKSTVKFKPSIQKSLLKQFPSVKCVDSQDPDLYEGNIANAIIFPM